MNDASFEQAVEEIHTRDPRYAVDSYYFLREALDYTVKALKKSPDGTALERHVTGRELLEGLRDYTLQEFGPLALTVLHQWGVRCTEDFGNMVFNLVAAGKLGKTETDQIADFAAGYDFHEAFARPFEADAAPVVRSRRRRPGGR